MYISEIPFAAAVAASSACFLALQIGNTDLVMSRPFLICVRSAASPLQHPHPPPTPAPNVKTNYPPPVPLPSTTMAFPLAGSIGEIPVAFGPAIGLINQQSVACYCARHQEGSPVRVVATQVAHAGGVPL